MGSNCVDSIKAFHDPRDTSALGRQGRRKIDTRARAWITTDAKPRMRELELENEELKRANEILKAASIFAPPCWTVASERHAVNSRLHR
ncbi:hypothetical protein FEAC_10690 [Ferrimicrobium acidiphilum DSM 19497]|uniref:Transposase n=1 Tax=Ferrimicrobium acidiphilum DSM 19497 TaxID=1121877 RepID=A0A0D8FW13_9ACTN|nr:hypothetical protein FEAC_10690 [Ferrimicrobium acidiphilum DSM 19497]